MITMITGEITVDERTCDDEIEWAFKICPKIYGH